MTRATHDRQIVQIRMSGGTLLIGPTQHPDIAFWQKVLRQGQLHPLAGHGLRQAERTCHAGPELRLLLDRLGVSTRSMSDTEAGYAVQRAIHDKRLSAVFIPATKAQPDADTGLAGKLVPAPVSSPQTVKPGLPAGAQRGPPSTAASPVNKQPAFDVARATPPERMVEMLRRTPRHLEGQLKRAVDEMLLSGSVASLGLGLATLAAAHIIGAGEAFDTILAGFAFITAGWSGLIALRNIILAVIKAATSTRDAELDEAAELFAGGITVLGEAFIAFVMARLVRRGAGAREAAEEDTISTHGQSRGRPSSRRPSVDAADSEALQSKANATSNENRELGLGAPKLDEAIAARDRMAANLRMTEKRPPATVTAGYNTETGEVAAAASGNKMCAEEHVVDKLGGDKNKIRFTKAIRPRTGEEVPICDQCQEKYDKSQFPPETKFKGKD